MSSYSVFRFSIHSSRLIWAPSCWKKREKERSKSIAFTVSCTFFWIIIINSEADSGIIQAYAYCRVFQKWWQYQWLYMRSTWNRYSQLFVSGWTGFNRFAQCSTCYNFIWYSALSDKSVIPCQQIAMHMGNDILGSWEKSSFGLGFFYYSPQMLMTDSGHHLTYYVNFNFPDHSVFDSNENWYRTLLARLWKCWCLWTTSWK